MLLPLLWTPHQAKKGNPRASPRSTLRILYLMRHLIPADEAGRPPDPPDEEMMTRKKLKWKEKGRQRAKQSWNPESRSQDSRSSVHASLSESLL